MHVQFSIKCRKVEHPAYLRSELGNYKGGVLDSEAREIGKVS